MFTCIIDCENMHYTSVIRNDSNFVFPKELTPSFIKFSNSYLRRFSDRILYLSLYLKIDDWIVVFIDQIFLNLKEKGFIYFLKQDLSDIKTDRQKHPFCDEIKEFLETLKNNMVSSVYAVFYTYEIKDLIF
ncbi:hypothetical protein CWI39_0534p0010 [Hamiltosporidium magnivora]|uniref:Uncharacterized protein n=1 Tax=Hamiltosporidium magnivora TaxID=148818 RepID=A0A4V2JW17_9MICR|nr:hypothetical protein CWI39_0534p0010 [Hamiltosporidium magnivora]